MSDTKTYTTTRVLRHNGKKFEIGADVDLDKHFAEPLLAAGAIQPKTVKLDDTDSGKQDDGNKTPAGDQNPPPSLDDKSGAGQSENGDAGNKDGESGKDEKTGDSKPAYDDITVEKIKEKLTELKIDFTGKTAKKDLYDLLPG